MDFMAGRKTSGKKKSFFDMYDEMVKQAQEEVKSVESDVTVGIKNIRKLEDDINKALGERASLYTKIKEDLDYRQGIANRISEVALSEITLALGDIVDPLVDVDAEIIRTSNEEDSEAGSPEVEAETAVKKGTSNKGNSSKDADPLDPDSESSSGIEDPQSVVADDGVSTDSDDADESEDDPTGNGEEEASDSQDDGDLNDVDESEPIADENNESDSGDDANEDVREEEPVKPKRARRKTSKKNETQGDVEPAPVEDQEGDAVSDATGDSVASDVVIDDLPGDGDEVEIPNPTEEADLTGGDESFDGDADVDEPAGSESGEPTLIGEDTPYSDEEMDFGL